MLEQTHDRRPCRVEPDEAARRRAVAGLVDLLVALARRDGVSAPPPEHEAIRSVAVEYVFELGDLCPGIRRVRVAQRTSSTPAMWVTVERPGSRESVWLPQSSAWEAQPLVAELLARLHGDELEVDASLAGEHPILAHSTFVHPDGWWPSFKSRPFGAPGATVGDLYRDELYPAVVETLRPSPGRVLDLGGGDGELAALLLESGAATRVVAVDRNTAQVASARARLAGMAADVVQVDVGTRSWVEWLGGPFDAIVAVGLFESNVLSTPVALAALSGAISLLRDPGVFVSTGSGASLVNRANLESRGLWVTNTSLPGGVVGGAAYPFYVARTPRPH